MTDSELEELKNRLLEEYRANGGRKDLSSFTATQVMNEIDHLKEIKKLEAQVEQLKNNKEPDKPVQFFGRINAGRQNAELVREATEMLGGYIDYLDPPFDERSIEDERYKRDNEICMLCEPGKEDTVLILRDKDGRMA